MIVVFGDRTQLLVCCMVATSRSNGGARCEMLSLFFGVCARKGRVILLPKFLWGSPCA